MIGISTKQLRTMPKPARKLTRKLLSTIAKHEQYFREAESKLLAWLAQVDEKENSFLEVPPRWYPPPEPSDTKPIKRPTVDRCLKCGSPKPLDKIQIDGTPFWFCRPLCLNQSINEYLDERWLDQPYNDKDYERYIHRVYGQTTAQILMARHDLHEEWHQRQKEAFERARNVLEGRLRAEAQKLGAEEAEKEAEMADRQWQKDFETAHKEHEEFLAAEEIQEAIKFNPIPEHLRVHTGIIAKTGWGKTQLLQSLILEQLQHADPPSLIVLDSTGQMVGLLQRLALFNTRLRDRLVIIDPAHSPSLNMFDFSNPRFEAYTPEQKEDTQSEIVSLFNYVFGAQDYDLSGQMGLAFAYSTRLMLSRPGSTIRDLRRLMEETPKRWEDSAYASTMAELDEDARDFFKLHFYADTLKSTKSGIARRLQLMTAVPAFGRMFITAKNSLDLYSETQDRGSIILVNTNEQMLKDGGYVLFGRYIVARTMAAIMERASIPRDQRRTTHLIIDEGSPYMDATFDALLTRVRQYGLKVTIAFQHFQQLTDKLRNAVAGQTSVKYAGGLSYSDARFLSNEMRCEPEFLMDLRTDITQPPSWTEFGVHADNWTTKHPMKLRLPFYALENQPMMTVAEHTALLERNKKRMAPETHKAPETAKEPPPTATPPQKLSSPAPKPETQPHSDAGDPADKWG